MKLAIVEVLDRDGHARLIVPVTSWPVTIGRAIECDVVLDDAHAAARHATLTGAGAWRVALVARGRRDDALTLTAGETVNGVQIGKRRIAAQQSVTLAPATSSRSATRACACGARPRRWRRSVRCCRSRGVTCFRWSAWRRR